MMTQPSSGDHNLLAEVGDLSDEPAVPPGAEPDQWIGGQRDVYAQIGYVAVSTDLLSCPAVTLVAEQRADGSLGVIDVMLDVAMGRSDAGLSTAQARELADLLHQAADLADQWTGTSTGQTPLELLANAFSALRTAYSLLRVLPGNADSYVRAALDSISDAAEVLR